MGINYELYLSEEAKRTETMPIRKLYEVKLQGPPDLVSLGDGSPSPDTFPLSGISLKFKDGSEEVLDPSEVDRALQYSATAGSLSYRKLLRDLVYKLHKPPLWDKPREDGGTIILPCSGATDGNAQLVGLLTNPGDTILVEDFAYTGILCRLKALGIKTLRVQMDAEGLVPDSLKAVMSQWEGKDLNSEGRPRMLYTVPTGHNPTGFTYTEERKRQIYKIAQKCDLLILSDDAYHMLSYNKLVPSFLSMDTDGRVIRVDTFSKTLGPGFRAGYITGPGPIMAKLESRMGVTSHGTSAFSQAIVGALFRQLTIDGYIERCKKVAAFYKERRDLFMKYVEKWLKGLVEYDVPEAGMFLWIKVFNCDDTEDFVLTKAVSEGVLAVPGSCFQTGHSTKSPYIRLSFSMATETEMDTALRRLSEAIKKTFMSNTSIS